MSFDLYFFEPAVALSAATIRPVHVDFEAARFDGPAPLPDVLEEGGRTDLLIAALRERFPVGDPDVEEWPSDVYPLSSYPAGCDRTEASFHMNVRWSRSAEVASVVIPLALEQGMGVYDPQVDVAFNPRRVVVHPSDHVLDSPWVPSVAAEGPLLHDLVHAMGRKHKDAYFSVDRPGGGFMQTLHQGRGVYLLEYRRNEEGSHRQIAGGTDAETVVAAVEAYARRDDDTWGALPWMPLDLG